MHQLAAKLAKSSDHISYHHGVVITRGGAIVSMGFNHGWTHAEDSALSRIWPSERRGCKLWSIRVTKSGRYGNAKPCSKCMAMIRASGIKAVYFSNNQGVIEKMKVE